MNVPPILGCPKLRTVQGADSPRCPLEAKAEDAASLVLKNNRAWIITRTRKSAGDLRSPRKEDRMPTPRELDSTRRRQAASVRRRTPRKLLGDAMKLLSGRDLKGPAPENAFTLCRALPAFIPISVADLQEKARVQFTNFWRDRLAAGDFEPFKTVGKQESPREGKMLSQFASPEIHRLALIRRIEEFKKALEEHEWADEEFVWKESFVKALDKLLTQFSTLNGLLHGFQQVTNGKRRALELIQTLFGGEEAFAQIQGVTERSLFEAMRIVRDETYFDLSAVVAMQREGGFQGVREDLAAMEWTDLERGLYREAGATFSAIQVEGCGGGVAVLMGKGMNKEVYFRALYSLIQQVGLSVEGDVVGREEPAQRGIYSLLVAAMTIGGFAKHFETLKELLPGVNQFGMEGSPPLFDMRSGEVSKEVHVKVGGAEEFLVSKRQKVHLVELPEKSCSYRTGAPLALLECTFWTRYYQGEIFYGYNIDSFAFTEAATRELRTAITDRLNGDIARLPKK